MVAAHWTRERVPAACIASMLHTAASSDQSAWAFGISALEGTPFVTLVFRREEQGWQQVTAPCIGRVNRAIAVSDDDVWAVGDGESLHWDGGCWRHVPTADLPGARAQLFGLAQFGTADVWAAGYVPRRDHSGSRGTVQLWDGTAWTDQPLPSVARGWSLAGIGGVSADDLWAVGRGQPGHAVALHWNGQEWHQLPVPAPESGTVKLCDVAALASDDVWAAGYRTAPDGGAHNRHLLALHWDGSAWSPSELPAGPGQIWQLVKQNTAIWAIGYAPDSTPIVAKLSGSGWELQASPAPPPGAQHSSLYGGAILPYGNLLVVGATVASPDSTQPFAAVRHD
jgi:hypothetical protein